MTLVKSNWRIKQGSKGKAERPPGY